jgi:hypothetical protein
VYEFEAGAVALTVAFESPVTPWDMARAAGMASRITVEARPRDSAAHEVAVYLDCSAEWCVNTPEQQVRWSRARGPGLHILSFASQDQPVLAKRGDDLRIDWGTFFVATGSEGDAVIAPHGDSRRAFTETGKLAASDDMRQPRAANDSWPVLAVSRDLGRIAGPASWSVALGYDAGYSVELFGRKLRPLWSAGGATMGDELRRTLAAPGVEADDAKLMAELTRVGGVKYAELAGACLRQTMAAHTIAADWDGTPVMLSKENFSNGCIGTVDVLFPAAPFFLYFNPELLKAQMRPLMDYAASARWKFPFAPHDLGTYPLANGQVYGGGEKTEENQMPVEETGNMLILLGALAQADGNAVFVEKWWPTVEKWAGYLKDHALDPANQLCTDDFAGHLAHNANLAVKGIIGLGAYAQLCERLGKKEAAAEYGDLARRYATEWVKKAEDGDHYRLAYDKPGTWSQKYNLIWDRVLGTGLFPREVAEKEMAFYRTKVNTYGLPLDNREAYAKLDFSVWTACLTGNREDFDALVDPLHRFMMESPDRIPLTDWYGTVDGKAVGFRARSVVGAVYMPMLLDKLGTRE